MHLKQSAFIHFKFENCDDLQKNASGEFEQQCQQGS